MWKKHFDKIFLINLLERTDRLAEATAELSKHGISFEVVQAVKHERGAYGLYLTLRELFEKAEQLDLGNIMIFEDDIKLIDGVNDYLDGAIIDLNYIVWDMFYLGANVDGQMHRVPKCFYILRCQDMLATHAIAYSKHGWRKCLAEMRRLDALTGEPDAVDMIWMRAVQSQGKSFISSHLLATQRASSSDITEVLNTFTKEELNRYYKELLENRFNKRLKEVGL